MKEPSSFLWHDYETFGADPLYDRPAQFAAQRTDAKLQPMGEPVSWYCAPADDLLPHPPACLITGITPQHARDRGVIETEFTARIHAQMMVPGTCTVGYNSVRFDDVVTRHLFYRNLRDAYEREYRNGNSRWDLIDLARMCYALRPAGLEWPTRGEDDRAAPGRRVPSFRLEDLARENGIEHGQAHDARADVQATIELARRLKSAQPRLFDWALGMRDTAVAQALLDPVDAKPVVHTSARIPAARGCTTLVLPLAVLPDRPKSIVVFDLMADPQPLLDEPADALADRVFTPAADMPEGVERLPLKVVHCNHVPMLAPEATLQGVDLDRIGLDLEMCQRNAALLRPGLEKIRPKVITVFARPFGEIGETGGNDPDQMLYSGGFFSRHDAALMRKVLHTPAAELGRRVWSFEDPRMPVLLFRYRARNHPATLTATEAAAWDEDRARRLLEPADPRQLGFAEFERALAQARQEQAGNPAAQRILDQLESWTEESGLARLWRDRLGREIRS
jgi:exodeoxyribonuclease-1